MNVEEQTGIYIAAQPEPKRADLQELHRFTTAVRPGCKLWFLDGKNEAGKVVANPNIGYGSFTKTYADGTTREFYRVGLSANTSGISVYIMGLADKDYLTNTYGKDIGRASLSGYCIKFKKLADINIDVLKTAIRSRLQASS